MRYFTGKGDQGKASLGDEFLASKGNLIFDVIGSLDEATAHLGLAISFCQDSEIKEHLRTIQDHLSKIMGLLAGSKAANLKELSCLPNALEWLEEKIQYWGDSVDLPKGFLFAGQSVSGASIDIARTVIRRAERLAVRYFEKNKDQKNNVLIYLNRLSSFLFILRICVDHKLSTTGER